MEQYSERASSGRFPLVSREDEARRVNPPYMGLLQSILDSVSYCVVILRTTPHWSVRMASCSFRLSGFFYFRTDHGLRAVKRKNYVTSRCQCLENLY